MAGLVIITGANSSLAIPAAAHLLQNYPEYTVVFTVRDVSDENSRKLRDTIGEFPSAKASIVSLDLFSLSAVHAFADTVITRINRGEYPRLSAIVCNAYYWNLVQGPELTGDGFDKTVQVSFISHAALVLRLLGYFGEGRVVLLSSDSHWPGKNAMEKYPPGLPDDLELLVKPTVDCAGDERGRGYQRYATAKLALTTWAHALNKHLQEEPGLNGVTAIAVNPGNMVDSRALRTNTPLSLRRMQTFVYKPLLPVLRLAMGPTLRTAAPGGKDIIELTVHPKYQGERGFFTMTEKDESSPESRDTDKQSKLWTQTLRWARITKENSVLGAQDRH
ncbi:hypothetical protein HIM_02766 [Hirsutella minnesotensis 3608]|nr:hypothetical protein HIM_02766 [Hirsutella minnesotensis 3608]